MRGEPRPEARSKPFLAANTWPLSRPYWSLLPSVTSLNDAAYALGFDAIAYSSGGANPTPAAVAGFSRQVGEASASASMPAQMGVAEEVPPDVTHPSGASSS